MRQSTWHNITTGLHAAAHDSYMAKTARQRRKREVRRVMEHVDDFCRTTKAELEQGTYRVGRYRHFRLEDKKKARDISVLPYGDRVVQNAVKDAIEPLLMRRMTDDMMGGLPGRGVLASDSRHSIVSQMRQAMNDRTLTHYLQGDIRKFYDTVDNVVAMRLIERQVSDRRTLAVIRQHLFAQKRLAIGDPFSHLIANTVMSEIIRQAKRKYGRRIRLLNFADDFVAFARDKETLQALRKDMQQWAKAMRLHYKPMYVRAIDADPCAQSGGRFCRPQPVTFCGYQYGRGYVRLTQRTKKRYIKSRHSSRSMGSYQGIVGVADTRHLRDIVENKDNGTMNSEQKIRRPFAGRQIKIDTLENIPHTIVDFAEKPSRQQGCESYYHVQAIAGTLGLVVYSTGSAKICEYLKQKSRHDLPLRDMKIVHDWSGFYYDGTVYTDAEEEAMIREKFNIH